MARERYSKLRDEPPIGAEENTRRSNLPREYYSSDTPEGREAWLREMHALEHEMLQGVGQRRAKQPVDPLDRIRPKES